MDIKNIREVEKIITFSPFKYGICTVCKRKEAKSNFKTRIHLMIQNCETNGCVFTEIIAIWLSLNFFYSIICAVGCRSASKFYNCPKSEKKKYLFQPIVFCSNFQGLFILTHLEFYFFKFFLKPHIVNFLVC